MSLIVIDNYVGGDLRAPANGNYLDNINPATGQVYSKVPDSDEADIDAAVKSAEAAFPMWSQLPEAERAKYLNRIADLVERDLDDIARAETDDNGKPYSLAHTLDIPRVAANLRFYAGIAQGFASQSHAMPDAINYTLRRPIGVVTCISPWNLPLYLLSWKVAPALATGNCVIAKPSEVTPMTAFLFSKLCVEAGLPPGVLNIVHGSGAVTGNAILNHPGIKAVSFTGGTKTGKHIAEVVAPQLKKFSLELGGKNPNVVFADCDYEQMMQGSLRSSFANQGQVCLCGSRILVERPIYERFCNDFVEKAKHLKVGDPHESESNLGAVVSKPHQEKILRYIDIAKEEGGEILCGGNAAHPEGRCAEGYFVEPTVIIGLDGQCQTNQEEIFGPVVTIQPFDDEQQVVEMANETDYGLAASVWTSDIGRGHRMAEQIQSGVVWVNCWMIRDLRTPFGGMKQSGMGREGGLEAFRFFTEPKNVCVKYG